MNSLDAERLKNNIDEIANFDIKNNNVFGSSYYVYQKDNFEIKCHFGHTGNPRNSVDDGTIFRLASMTKPITSVAVLILADKGIISLDDSVSKFLPEFKNIHIISKSGVDLGSPSTEVNIFHLMTHTSGFGSGKCPKLTETDRLNADNTIKRYIDTGLEYEPFTSSTYSPYASFDVLAKIIEIVADCKYDEFLYEKIFKKCNMVNTTFKPTENQMKRLTKMHNKTDGKSVVQSMPDNCIFENFPATHCLAGAGLVSTLEDYTHFALMLLNDGYACGNQILSKNTLDKMFETPVFENIMPGQSWGLGVRVVTGKAYNYLPVGAFGWSGAYGPHFWIDHKNDICAVFMKNSLHDGGAGNSSANRFEEAVYKSMKY